jgi:hypothetical protein
LVFSEKKVVADILQTNKILHICGNYIIINNHK